MPPGGWDWGRCIAPSQVPLQCPQRRQIEGERRKQKQGQMNSRGGPNICGKRGITASQRLTMIPLIQSPLRHQPPLDVGFYEGLYRGTIGRCYYRVKRNIETLHSCIELLAFDAPIA